MLDLGKICFIYFPFSRSSYLGCITTLAFEAFSFFTSSLPFQAAGCMINQLGIDGTKVDAKRYDIGTGTGEKD